MLYTRRDIGKLALFGVPAAAWLGRRELSAAGLVVSKADSRWAGVEIGMNVPYNYDSTNHMSADEVLTRTVDLGISFVELRSQPVETFLGAPVDAVNAVQRPGSLTAGERKTLADALEKWRLALPMSRVQEFRKKYADAGVAIEIVKFDGIFQMSDRAIDYCFDLAKTLGARAISCEISVPDTKRLGQFADKHKMMVGYHGHQETTPAHWEEAFSYAKYNGANLDLGHFVAGNNISPIPFITEHHDRITHVHVKDMKKNHGPAVPFGEGDVPIVEALQLIRDKKWKIVGVIEFEYKVPPGSTYMAEIAKTIAYCKKALLA